MNRANVNGKDAKLMELMEDNEKLMELIETSWKYWKTPGTEATTAKKANVPPFFFDQRQM